jgi:hypothetical protein
MTKQELIEAGYDMTGGNVADISMAQLKRLMTVTQFVTDLCINEIEARGKLSFVDGVPVIPYDCDHGVETVLARVNFGPTAA